jgi:hypothetical protein
MAHRPTLRRLATVLGAATATAAALAVTAPAAAPAAPAASPVTAQSRAAAECDPFTAPELQPSVPTSEEVIGIELGERDVTTAESDRYLRAVSAASPKVVDGVLARSWQGRPLRYAVVGQPKWTSPAALRSIGQALNELRDADTRPARVRTILRTTPAVLWVAGNVHGGEESGADASLRVLYELAARTDCAAAEILDRAIVVVLPVQNPDGREADTRRNAYSFDLNRDWFARTQPETDGKVEKLRTLPPQLFIDAHEMGRETYFFPPNADPVYHDIGETPLQWIYQLYGPAMQASFTRFGIPFFNGDVYDLFYMGYGDTVPSTGFNAAGMTFEKANGDPTEQRVREQYVAIWTTLSEAGRRHSLLEEWRAEHVLAAAQGRAGQLEPNRLYWEGATIDNPVPNTPVRHYFLRPTPGKQAELERLVERLQRMDVEVYRLTRSLRVPDFRAYGRPAGAVTLPAGTVWVPMAQGQKHWVQAMLNEDTYVPFPYFYDVTAFSGPLLNNVPGGFSGAVLRPRATLMRAATPPAHDDVRRDVSVGLWQLSATATSSVESSGWLRWYLDHRVRLPYDDLTAADIAGGGLQALDVLLVPSGPAAEGLTALGDAGRAALTDWVRQGGTLVTLADSSRLAESLGLTTATSAEATSDIPGSLIRVELDEGSALARGVGPTAYAMYEYDLVWTVADAERAPVRFPAAGDPDWFVSGFAQGEEQLHGKAAVVDEAVGEGRVVLFGFDPNFRGFTDGTAKILRNAITDVRPADLPMATVQRDRGRRAVVAPASDRLVLTVRSSAADEVRAASRQQGAKANTVTGEGKVSFRVDLGGRDADDHPWATELADDVAGLGDEVVAIRLP